MIDQFVDKFKNMPRSEEQYEQIREERKQQIMHVALEIIAEEGFANSSISKIARKATISKGLMYNYFKSKEELISSIMIEGFNNLFFSFDKNKDGVLTTEELHYFIDQVFETVQQNIRFWRMYFMVLLQPDVFNLVEEQIMNNLQPFMETTYNYYVKTGSSNPQADTRLLAAILDGVGLHFVLDPDNFPLEAIKEKLHKILV